MLCCLDHSRSHCLPAPEPWVSGSAATRGSPAARDKAEAVGAGQRRECFVSAKQPPQLGVAGGGAKTLSDNLLPGKPPASSSLNTQRQWKQEGRGGGAQPDKGSNPTPGLSSFLQVLFFDPLKPSKEAQHSLTLGGEGGGVLEGTRNTSTGVCGPALHQKPQQISHPQAVSLTTCESLETP